jgi:hypothetical protein
MRVDVAAPARQLILGDCDRFEQIHGYPVSFVGNRRSKAMLHRRSCSCKRGYSARSKRRPLEPSPRPMVFFLPIQSKG